MELNYQQATRLHFEALREAGTVGSFPGVSALNRQEELFNSGKGLSLAVYEEHGLAGMISLLEPLPDQCSAIAYLRYRHYSEYTIAILMNSIREVAYRQKQEFILDSSPSDVIYSRVINHIWPEGKMIQVDREHLFHYAGSSPVDPNDENLVSRLEELRKLMPDDLRTQLLNPLRGSLPL